MNCEMSLLEHLSPNPWVQGIAFVFASLTVVVALCMLCFCFEMFLNWLDK